MRRSQCQTKDAMFNGECMEELVWLKIKHPEMTLDEIMQLKDRVANMAIENGRQVATVDDLNLCVTARVRHGDMKSGGFGGVQPTAEQKGVAV